MKTERGGGVGGWGRATQSGFIVFTDAHKQQQTGVNFNVSTDWRRLVNADLAVDVGSGIQQHLDHGLVPTHTGVHERGHPLWEGGGRRVTGFFYFRGGVKSTQRCEAAAQDAEFTPSSLHCSLDAERMLGLGGGAKHAPECHSGFFLC